MPEIFFAATNFMKNKILTHLKKKICSKDQKATKIKKSKYLKEG